ncbi:PIN-like domain-containing protein [Priestia megaterium]
MFAGLIDYSEDEFKKLWAEATFVVDTNVLLNFYKFTSKESTLKLFDILKDLKEKKRLWIPHQVALEYFFNYKKNLNKPKEGYNTLGSKVKKLESEAQKFLKSVISEYPYIQDDNFKFINEDLKELREKTNNQVKQAINDLPDPDTIKKDIEGLLEGIIGQPYDQKRINEIEKDGDLRYKNDVPPGFEDRDDPQKQNFRTFGDIKYQQLYGDLILWNQIIDQVNKMKIEEKEEKEEKATPIIFITEEKKEDWWEKDGSAIKRPQPHLIQEFLQKTGQKFYMYRTDNFVSHAKKHLGAKVTEEQEKSINQNLNNIRNADKNEEENLMNMQIFPSSGPSKMRVTSGLRRHKEFKKLFNNVSQFLDEDKLNLYKEKLNEVESMEESPATRYIYLNDLYRSGIKSAIPQMTRRLWDAIYALELLGMDEEVSNTKEILETLPHSEPAKAKKLLETLQQLDEIYQ